MILAIDTSTQWMGLAIFDGFQILYEKVWRTSRRHTVELTPAIQAALVETSLDSGAFRAVAVALGPGSFTSLRIGLAAAKGLAMAWHIPIIGVPSLDITAQNQAPADVPMIAVLVVGRGRLAAQKYTLAEEHWKADGEVFMASALELESMLTSPTLICGEINKEDLQILERRWRNALLAKPSQNLRRPSVLAELAGQRLEMGQVDDCASLVPVYLHTMGTPDD